MQTFQRKRVTMFTVRFKSMSAVFAVAFVTACASSGFDSQAIEGGPGQPIVVDIVGADAGIVSDREGSRLYELRVEVSNDSDVPLTVTKIMITSEGSGAFQVQTAAQAENEMIDPGKDHTFVLRVNGRLVRAFAPNEARVVRLRCVVALSNGDSYFYTFEGPVREQ